MAAVGVPDPEDALAKHHEEITETTRISRKQFEKIVMEEFVRSGYSQPQAQSN
jgi:hypothetical protein